MIFKTCTHCGTERNESCFYAQKNTKDGLSSWCKDCVKWLRKYKRGTAEAMPKQEPPKIRPALRSVIAAVESGYSTAPRVGRQVGVSRQVASKWLVVAADEGAIVRHRHGLYGPKGSKPPIRLPHDASWRQHAALERRLATASRALNGLSLHGACLFCEHREHTPDCPRFLIEEWIRIHRGQFSPCVAKVVQYA